MGNDGGGGGGGLGAANAASVRIVLASSKMIRVDQILKVLFNLLHLKATNNKVDTRFGNLFVRSGHLFP